MDQLAQLLFLALLLIAAGLLWRRKAGFGSGRTISHDNLKLSSKRFHLVGVPDRIVRQGGVYIPEDKKSGSKVRDAHRAQMGIYFILVEEHFGRKPPFGFIVLNGGRREKIDNTPQLRAQVLNMADQIRQARTRLHRPTTATPFLAKCRACSQKGNCQQNVSI